MPRSGGLLHEAADDGHIAGHNAATFPEIRAHVRRIPISIVFSDPQMAVVGTPGEIPMFVEENLRSEWYGLADWCFRGSGTRGNPRRGRRKALLLQVPVLGVFSC